MKSSRWNINFQNLGTLLILLIGLMLRAAGGQEEIKHNLPPNLEIIDPKSLGLSDSDLDKFLGRVKLLPIGDSKTQILTVGFEGDENINLEDFESLSTDGLPDQDKKVAQNAFSAFQKFFKDPKKTAVDFDKLAEGGGGGGGVGGGPEVQFVQQSQRAQPQQQYQEERPQDQSYQTQSRRPNNNLRDEEVYNFVEQQQQQPSPVQFTNIIRVNEGQEQNLQNHRLNQNQVQNNQVEYRDNIPDLVPPPPPSHPPPPPRFQGRIVENLPRENHQNFKEPQIQPFLNLNFKPPTEMIPISLPQNAMQPTPQHLQSSTQGQAPPQSESNHHHQHKQVRFRDENGRRFPSHYIDMQTLKLGGFGQRQPKVFNHRTTAQQGRQGGFVNNNNPAATGTGQIKIYMEPPQPTQRGLQERPPQQHQQPQQPHPQQARKVNNNVVITKSPGIQVQPLQGTPNNNVIVRELPKFMHPPSPDALFTPLVLPQASIQSNNKVRPPPNHNNPKSPGVFQKEATQNPPQLVSHPQNAYSEDFQDLNAGFRAAINEIILSKNQQSGGNHPTLSHVNSFPKPDGNQPGNLRHFESGKHNSIQTTSDGFSTSQIRQNHHFSNELVQSSNSYQTQEQHTSHIPEVVQQSHSQPPRPNQHFANNNQKPNFAANSQQQQEIKQNFAANNNNQKPILFPASSNNQNTVNHQQNHPQSFPNNPNPKQNQNAQNFHNKQPLKQQNPPKKVFINVNNIHFTTQSPLNSFVKSNSDLKQQFQGSFNSQNPPKSNPNNAQVQSNPNIIQNSSNLPKEPSRYLFPPPLTLADQLAFTPGTTQSSTPSSPTPLRTLEEGSESRYPSTRDPNSFRGLPPLPRFLRALLSNF